MYNIYACAHLRQNFALLCTCAHAKMDDMLTNFMGVHTVADVHAFYKVAAKERAVCDQKTTTTQKAKTTTAGFQIYTSHTSEAEVWVATCACCKTPHAQTHALCFLSCHKRLKKNRSEKQKAFDTNKMNTNRRDLTGLWFFWMLLLSMARSSLQEGNSYTLFARWISCSIMP